MTSPFFPEAKSAMAKVLLAQERSQRLKARAARRLEGARHVHAEQVAAAEEIEAAAWADLFTVPGMTVPTAAAMLQVDEASVAGWASRSGKKRGVR